MKSTDWLRGPPIRRGGERGVLQRRVAIRSERRGPVEGGIPGPRRAAGRAADLCDYVCPGDVIHQEPRADQLPVIAYPDECWYCGLCEQACPSDAITIVFPQEMLAPTTPVQALLGRDPD